jgi:hypothetical protein
MKVKHRERHIYLSPTHGHDEGLEGHLAVVQDSVQGTLFIDLKYIENYFGYITLGRFVS